jgi:hypothetical protein
MAIQVNVPYSANPQFIPEFTDKPYPYSTDWQLAITNAVTQNYTAILTGISDPTTTTGDMLYRGISGLTRLPIGTTSQVLSTQSGIPTWANLSTLLGISGTGGRILYWNGTAIVSLPTPVASSVLTHSGVSGSAPSWSASGSTGFVSGPLSSIDNRIMLFSGTTGKVAKMSGVTIDASNNITGIVNATASGTVTAVTGNTTGTHTVGTLASSTGGINLTSGANYRWQVSGQNAVRLYGAGTSVPNAEGNLELGGPNIGNTTFSPVRIRISGNNNTANSAPQTSTLYSTNIPKAFAKVAGTGVVISRFNVASVVKTGTGTYLVNMNLPMSSANYCVNVTTFVGGSVIGGLMVQGTSSFNLEFRLGASQALSDTPFFISVLGDQ